jgi:hypothetical protein
MGLWPGGFLTTELEGNWGDAVNGFTGALLPVNTSRTFPVFGETVLALPALNFRQALVLPTKDPKAALVSLSVVSSEGKANTPGFSDLRADTLTLAGEARVRTNFFGRTGHQLVGFTYSNQGFDSECRERCQAASPLRFATPVRRYGDPPCFDYRCLKNSAFRPESNGDCNDSHGCSCSHRLWEGVAGCPRELGCTLPSHLFLDRDHHDLLV